MKHEHPLASGGFLRLREVLQYIPVSKTLWYAGIKTGIYPKPIRLSPGRVGWAVKDIQDLIVTLNENKTDILENNKS